MFRSRFILTAVVAVATALLAPAVSKADFTITISDGDGSTPDFAGGFVGNTANGTFSFNYGTGVLTVNFHLQANVPGSVNIAQITSFQSSVQGTGTFGPKDIVVTADAFNFTNPQPPGELQTTLTSTNLSSGPQVGATSADGLSRLNGATVAGTALTIDTEETVKTLVPVAYATPFTLGNQMTLHLTGAVGAANDELANATITSEIIPSTAVPAPAGLVMLAGALPFAGLLRLRRRLAKPEATTAA